MPRLSQLFAPREREFFDLFEEAGANIVRATELLQRILQTTADVLPAPKIKPAKKPRKTAKAKKR